MTIFNRFKLNKLEKFEILNEKLWGDTKKRLIKRVNIKPFELEIFTRIKNINVWGEYIPVWEKQKIKNFKVGYKLIFSAYHLKVGWEVFDVFLRYDYEGFLKNPKKVEKRMKELEPKITKELFGIIMGEE